MPRHPTEAPLKVIAVRLPQTLIAQAERHADLHHTSISALLREGLEMRLHDRQSAQKYNGNTAPSPEMRAMLAHLATTLVTAAEEVRKACGGDIARREYNSNTITEKEAYNGTTSEEQPYNGMTSSLAPPPPPAPTLAPDDQEPQTTEVVFDPAVHRLGKPCTRNHLYGDTGKTPRLKKSGNCPICKGIEQHARRQRQREGA
jgi:hypothetical protein